MLTAVTVLALVAGVLACISLIPHSPKEPILAVSLLLLAVAVFLLGGH